MAASLTTRQVENVTVIDAAGRIVIGESATALQALLRRLTAEEHKRIVLNLGGVSFMDSAGIGELVGCYASASRKGTKIKICELTRRVSDLFQVTHIYNILDIYQREEDALQSFRQPR
ncbi:MAG TPA: STAS domain-containing protein [Bryobacteraceae bacterium]|nr:STAS domain-containing protein [Bryobacteraceae bacterium]